jgi:hypothetical protein
MEKNERQKARIDLIKSMLAGQSWREAFAATEPAPLKRAMAYRLVHAVRMRGDATLADGRQGHPSKLRGEARAFLARTVFASSSYPFIHYPGGTARTF